MADAAGVFFSRLIAGMIALGYTVSDLTLLNHEPPAPLLPLAVFRARSGIRPDVDIRMVIIGDISGIQSYLFDVAEEGGGQAQRLRARSFVIQLAAEMAALRVLLAVGWPQDDSHFVFSAAGKFVLQGPDSDDAAPRLAAAQDYIGNWLLRETRGELRLALGWADGSGVGGYRLAQGELQRAKARPWAPQGAWAPDALVLEPLGVPCALCRHAPAAEDEPDRDTGATRRICHWCVHTRHLGRRLPRGRWLVIQEEPRGADLDLLRFGATVSGANRVEIGSGTVAVANLQKPKHRPEWCPPNRFLSRRLMAYVTFDEDGAPTWFMDIAAQSRGDRLLGVLKADADSLGQAIEAVLRANSDLRPFAAFADQLDDFFAGRLKEEIELGRNPCWQWIYTVFAGGDDLIMVGPWDVMIDFAGRLHELFEAEFKSRRLTISAGLAFCKPKRPIKAAVAEAERLLEQAKTEPKASAKDQLACFGQVWKWKDHAAIVGVGRRLVEWVDGKQMERGWLHTLLGLAEARHPAPLRGATATAPRPDYLATARLAHHVARNYRLNTDARRWAERVIERFDDPTHTEIRYLPATVRYALTATRTPGEED